MAEAWGGGDGGEREQPGAVQRATRALDDVALLRAMREGDPAAWAEYVSRFRPLLEQFARRTGVPPWEVPACVTDVLDDEALRLTGARATTPASLGGYLVRALYHRWLRERRGTARRERRHADALMLSSGGAAADGVLRALCSSHALRVSEGASWVDASAAGALARLAAVVTRDLPDEDVLLLTWAGEGVPRRQMAEWLGVGYEAARKRLLRLAHRLREVAAQRAHELSADDRREVARFLRRAAMPPVRAPAPRSASAHEAAMYDAAPGARTDEEGTDE